MKPKRSRPRWRTAAIITVCLACLALVFRMEHKQYGDPFLSLRMAVTSILWPAHVAASKADLNSKTNFISFSRIDNAQEISKGEGVKIAICDWLFDMSGPATNKYVDAASMIPGGPVGSDRPWHGEWMAELVHQTAPACKIIPVRARTGDDDYAQYLIKGIRYAADHGAVAVTSSMGPLKMTEELRAAVDYAESKETLFINVHPIYDVKSKVTNPTILHTGVVSVPWHPTRPRAGQDIHVWPYALTHHLKDDWGFSMGPPIVAGVVALMKSANPALTPRELKAIIVETAVTNDGFRVLNAEAASNAAVKSGLDKPKIAPVTAAAPSIVTRP
jgi:hypothetical protein